MLIANIENLAKAPPEIKLIIPAKLDELSLIKSFNADISTPGTVI